MTKRAKHKNNDVLKLNTIKNLKLKQYKYYSKKLETLLNSAILILNKTINLNTKEMNTFTYEFGDQLSEKTVKTVALTEPTTALTIKRISGTVLPTYPTAKTTIEVVFSYIIGTVIANTSATFRKGIRDAEEDITDVTHSETGRYLDFDEYTRKFRIPEDHVDGLTSISFPKFNSAGENQLEAITDFFGFIPDLVMNSEQQTVNLNNTCFTFPKSVTDNRIGELKVGYVTKTTYDQMVNLNATAQFENVAWRIKEYINYTTEQRWSTNRRAKEAAVKSGVVQNQDIDEHTIVSFDITKDLKVVSSEEIAAIAIYPVNGDFGSIAIEIDEPVHGRN